MHSLNTWPWLCHPQPLLLGLWVPGALQAHVACGGGMASHAPLPPSLALFPLSLSPPCSSEWGSQCSCQLSTSTSLSITPCATTTWTPACHMPCPHPQHSPGEVSLQPMGGLTAMAVLKAPVLCCCQPIRAARSHTRDRGWEHPATLCAVLGKVSLPSLLGKGGQPHHILSPGCASGVPCSTRIWIATCPCKCPLGT